MIYLVDRIGRHRLSTIANADNILVVRDGSIVERGTHQELVKLNGYYHSLWSRQASLESASSVVPNQSEANQYGNKLNKTDDYESSIDEAHRATCCRRHRTSAFSRDSCSALPVSRSDQNGSKHLTSRNVISSRSRHTAQENKYLERHSSKHPKSKRASKGTVLKPDAPEFVPQCLR